MSEAKVSKRGRKPTLTDSDRKRRRTEINAKNNKNRIYIGAQYDRWSELKSALRVQTHAEVAKILLDGYEKHTMIDQRIPVPNDINIRPTSPPRTCSENQEETSAVDARVVNTRDVCTFEDQPDVVEPVEDSLQSDDEFPEYIIQYKYDEEAIAMEDQESLQSQDVKTEMVDSDGIFDNEFHVVFLDHVYCQRPYVNFGELVCERTRERLERERTRESFINLKEECKLNLTEHANFELVKRSKYLRYVELYDTEIPTIQTCITIYENFRAEIIVHGQKLSDSHAIWNTPELPSEFVGIHHVQKLLQTVSYYTVCIGNPDPDFLNNLPLGDYGNKPSSTCAGYLEETFGAFYRYFYYNRTIRSSNCSFLSLVERCKNCKVYRKSLFNKKNRLNTLYDGNSD